MTAISSENSEETFYLLCGEHHVWSAEQCLATFELFDEGAPYVTGRTLLPHDWSLSSALLNPVSDLEIASLVEELQSLRNPSSLDHDDTYLERLAVSTDWFAHRLHKTEWSFLDRKGAAWVHLYLGLVFHQFVPRLIAVAREVLEPTSTFFEEYGSAQELHSLLVRAFEPGRHQLSH